MASVDVVEVARKIIACGNDPDDEWDLDNLTGDEARALARVVLAAAEYLAAAANAAALANDAIGPHWAKRNTAYDALAATLKGGEVSKPYGLATTMQVIRPSRAEDKIYEAVQEAICASMTVSDFIREAREAWEYETKEQLRHDLTIFNAALKGSE